jgi:hypothetical protein
VALLALAAQSPGDAPAPSLAAKTSKLWSHDGENGDSSTQAVAVNEDDISNLGLRAPSGFNVPSVNVTADDIARYLFLSYMCITYMAVLTQGVLKPETCGLTDCLLFWFMLGQTRSRCAVWVQDAGRERIGRGH